MARLVGYEFHGIVTPEAEAVLELAKRNGIVTDGDHNSTYMWINGQPGAKLRTVRNRLKQLICLV